MTHRLAHLTLYLFLAPPFLAQAADAASPVQPAAAAFTGASRLVLVPATVVDRKGTPLAGLTAANFSILEDGERRAIVSFGEEDSPVSLGIVLDVSQSMRSWLDEA
ncbi:MAG TPA: hypothetical protein VEF06_08950, partial [Bryobacteraceae bacterium]|nr:hypothetical protein [Bryobacteraceae bacterium]